MLIKDWMSKNVVTVTEDTSMMDASQIMREKKFRRLPVLDKKGKLCGIVSDRDIKEASPSKATTLDIHELYYLLSKIKVKEVMTKRPTTIGVEDTVERAAVIMLEKNIGGLPVMDDAGEVVGILTQNDVFRVLVSITGVYRGGVQVAFELDDRGGSIKEVADVIRGSGGRLTSILTSYDNVPDGKRKVFIRFRDVPKDKLQPLLDDLKVQFTLLYHVEDKITP